MVYPGEPWVRLGNGLYERPYDSDDEYRDHQRSKLDTERLRAGIERTDKALEGALRSRIPEPPHQFAPALCLGARLGGEVRAFRARDWNAIGIDLNPGRRNPHVVEGDMHDVPAVDAWFQLVYANCLDHVRNLGQVLDEVRRVLVPGGLFVVEAIGPKPSGAPRTPQAWESFWWDEPRDLFHAIRLSGLHAVSRLRISEPWHGEQAIFRVPCS